MKLATLAEPVKTAYRQGTIDTATAETFASVPAERQLEVWQEVGGNPQHAHHVRSVIANAWIDASCATFNLAKLPDGAISRDLFAERVLIERKAFMEAQAEALLDERQKLIEEGWAEVVVGPQADVQDRLWSMDEAPQEFGEPTTTKLEKLANQRGELEAKFGEALSAVEGDDDNDPDHANTDALSAKLEALDDEENSFVAEAEPCYAEPTKAIGTAFLLLDPDGRVRRLYRTPRPRRAAATNGYGPMIHGDGSTDTSTPPTSGEMKEPRPVAVNLFCEANTSVFRLPCQEICRASRLKGALRTG